MKTKAQDLMIALSIFDIIYLSIASLMINTDLLPTLPNLYLLFNFNYLFSYSSAFIGVAPNINIFGYIIGLGWLYSIIQFLLIPFSFFYLFISVITSELTYIYDLMTIPLSILPYGLSNIFVLLFSVPIIIAIIMGIRIFYTGID